jgi:hypothetical protein
VRQLMDKLETAQRQARAAQTALTAREAVDAATHNELAQLRAKVNRLREEMVQATDRTTRLLEGAGDEATTRAAAQQQLAAAEAALWESRTEAATLRSELWRAEQRLRKGEGEAAARAAERFLKVRVEAESDALRDDPREVYVRVLEHDLHTERAAVEQLRQEVAHAHYMEAQTQHLLHEARKQQTQVRGMRNPSLSGCMICALCDTLACSKGRGRGVVRLLTCPALILSGVTAMHDGPAGEAARSGVGVPAAHRPARAASPGDGGVRARLRVLIEDIIGSNALGHALHHALMRVDLQHVLISSAWRRRRLERLGPKCHQTAHLRVALGHLMSAVEHLQRRPRTRRPQPLHRKAHLSLRDRLWPASQIHSRGLVLGSGESNPSLSLYWSLGTKAASQCQSQLRCVVTVVKAATNAHRVTRTMSE